jgi:hypothetical protein
MSRARTLADQFNSDGDLALTPVASVNAGQIGGRRNLILNGAMQVAQRGTSFTTSALQVTTYTVDRWAYYNDVASKRTIEQSSTAPNGFNNSLKVTVIGTDTIGPQQMIRCLLEGQNLTALDWASGSGNSATLSFWVRSSVTGQHGGAIQDSSGSYSYPFAYTVSSANVWEHKTVYITAPTGGTWNYTNGLGMSITFENGVGYQKNTAGAWTATNTTSSTGSVNLCATNGATWYITGVQLELGDTASDFEHRSYGEELSLCQRYYWKSFNQDTAPANNIPTSNNIHSDGYGSWTSYSTSDARTPYFYHPVAMRTAPTIALYSSERANTAGKTAIFNGGWAAVSLNGTQQNENRFAIYCTSTGLTANNSYLFAGGWTCDSEL